MHRINPLTCWPAVHHATTVPMNENRWRNSSVFVCTSPHTCIFPPTKQAATWSWLLYLLGSIGKRYQFPNAQFTCAAWTESTSIQQHSLNVQQTSQEISSLDNPKLHTTRIIWQIAATNEWFSTVRLYWARDNLGEWDELCYESCPWCSPDRSLDLMASSPARYHCTTDAPSR